MDLKEMLSGNGEFQLDLSNGNTWNTSEIDSVKEVGKEKIGSLKNAIDELNSMIEERQVLSDQIVRECDKMKGDLSNFILSGNTGKPGQDLEMKDKTELRKKIIEISELQLNEKVSCWQDIATLKKELRDKQKELSEREGRLNVLDKILE